MAKEFDDFDILRSEGEGFGMVNFDMLSGEEIEAQELYVFMQKTVDGFKTHTDLLGVEEASIVTLSQMSKKDIVSFVDVVKKHLIPSVCHAHEQDIVNDENYSEDVEEGEPTEGPVIDYELNGGNMGRFLILEGAEGLRSHIKYMLGDDEWKKLEDIEMQRIFNDDRWHRGGVSG